MAEPETTTKAWWSATLSSPEWWLHNIVVAIVVGLIVSVRAIVGQYWVDNRREEREHALAARQARQAEQLQNLQFVRSGSSRDPDQDRPLRPPTSRARNSVSYNLWAPTSPTRTSRTRISLMQISPRRILPEPISADPISPWRS